jgi:putative redox protein
VLLQFLSGANAFFDNSNEMKDNLIILIRMIKKTICLRKPGMPKTITVTHEYGVKLKIEREGHVLYSDQPPEEDGKDEGFSPTEILAASLASCVAYFAVRFLQARKLNTEGLKVDIDHEYANSPRRLSKFKLKIELPQDFPEKYRKAIVKSVESCSVHNTLTHPPEITVDVA